MINNIEDVKQGILVIGLREHVAKNAETIISYVRGDSDSPHLKTYYGKRLIQRVEERIIEIKEALAALDELTED